VGHTVNAWAPRVAGNVSAQTSLMFTLAPPHGATDNEWYERYERRNVDLKAGASRRWTTLGLHESQAHINMSRKHNTPVFISADTVASSSAVEENSLNTKLVELEALTSPGKAERRLGKSEDESQPAMATI